MTGGGETKSRPADDFEWWQTAQQGRTYVTLGGQVIAVHAEGFVPSGGAPPTGCASLPLPAGLPPGSGPALLLLYGLAAVALAHVGLRLGRLPALVALGTGGAFLVVFLVPPGLRPARAQATPGITYYHQDHLGSTVIVTGGPTATRVVYAPFGKVVAETAGGSTAAPDVGFTGQRFEAAVGIYDYGARWYHPDVGHFLTPDQIVPDAYDSQSLNRYAYVRNNPINKIDPTGNAPIGVGPGNVWDDPGFAVFDDFGRFDPFDPFVMAPPPPPPPPPEPRSELEQLLDPFGEGGSFGLLLEDEARRTYALRGDAAVSWAFGVALQAASGPIGLTLRGWALAAVEDQVGFTPRAPTRGGAVPNRIGRSGEDYLERTFGGRSRVSIETSQGARVVDSFAGGIARESKVGRVSMSVRIRDQVSKDLELLQTRSVDAVEWHFFVSPLSGRGGPTHSLERLLKDCGIGCVVHE